MKIYVNHHGWICGVKADYTKKGLLIKVKEIYFTKHKVGAKPFSDDNYDRNTGQIIDYCRNKMGCHIDRVYN